MRYISGLLLAATLSVALHAEERWYQLRLGGQPTGYSYTKLEPRNGGGSQLTEEMRFVVNRLGTKVELRSRSITIDDIAGRLISVEGETSSSHQTTRYEARVRRTAIDLRTTAGEKTYDRSLSAPESPLSPRGVALLCSDRLKKVHDSISFLQLLPDSGSIATFVRTLVDEAEVDGQVLFQVEETNSVMPGKRQIWFDREFTVMRAAFDLPFGRVDTEVTDRETALRAAAGAELKSESYDRTLARSNIRLPDPRSIDRIKLKLTHHRPELGWPPFESQYQQILESTPETAILEVWRPAPNGRRSEITLNERDFLRPNAILQSDDPEVIHLARSLTSAPDLSRVQKARILQNWVANNLKLDLGVALAPASEVVRNRGGTCIAYSVLLASLARAAGIPSRVAMGYVYTSGIWGGHAWTEILADGRWLPFDAAAYSPGTADAARFQFGSYNLEDNMLVATAEAAKMYSNIDVTILEYSIAGRSVSVPVGSKPYIVSENDYTSPWLGFSFRLPEGSAFTKLDAVYPDTTVVAAERRGSRVTVALHGNRSDPDEAVERTLAAVAPGVVPQETHIAGRRAWLASGATADRLVVLEANSIWVITSEGPSRGPLLKAVIASWKWTSPN
jgi:Transglutaminase-like superfamily